MSYTTAEITEKEDEVTALKAAYTQSLSTGGVIEFRQGNTHFEKASTKELKVLKNEAENELYIMKQSA